LLKEHLLEQLSKQRIPLGAKLPSEARLMQKFSLSRSTSGKSSQSFLSKDLSIANKAGTFHIPHKAAGHRTQRSMLVGVWFNWPTGPLSALSVKASGMSSGVGYHGV